MIILADAAAKTIMNEGAEQEIAAIPS